MAVRYSGDVEVRLSFRGGFYHATVRAPGYHGRGVISAREAGVRSAKGARTPEAYDRAARTFLLMVKERGVRLPTGELSRVFKSPCPLR